MAETLTIRFEEASPRPSPAPPPDAAAAAAGPAGGLRPNSLLDSQFFGVPAPAPRPAAAAAPGVPTPPTTTPTTPGMVPPGAPPAPVSTAPAGVPQSAVVALIDAFTQALDRYFGGSPGQPKGGPREVQWSPGMAPPPVATPPAGPDQAERDSPKEQERKGASITNKVITVFHELTNTLSRTLDLMIYTIQKQGEQAVANLRGDAVAANQAAMEEKTKVTEEIARWGGRIIGGIGGFVVGGPVGAAIGAGVGGELAGSAGRALGGGQGVAQNAQFIRFDQESRQRIQELSRYDGRLAAEAARSRVQGQALDIQEARQNGPRYAELARAQRELDASSRQLAALNNAQKLQEQMAQTNQEIKRIQEDIAKKMGITAEAAKKLIKDRAKKKTPLDELLEGVKTPDDSGRVDAAVALQKQLRDSGLNVPLLAGR